MNQIVLRGNHSQHPESHSDDESDIDQINAVQDPGTFTPFDPRNAVGLADIKEGQDYVYPQNPQGFTPDNFIQNPDDETELA